MQNVMELPPAVSSVPGTGFSLTKLRQLQLDPLTFMSNATSEFGDISRFGLLFGTGYLVSDPKVIEDVLLRDHHVFIKDVMTRELGYILGNGLLTSEGEHWKRVRKLAAPPLTKRAISAYADAMVSATSTAVAAFTPEVERDVHQDFMQLTLEIVTRTLFGATLPPGSEQVGEALHTAMDFFLNYSRSLKRLIPKWLPIPAHLRMRQVIKTIDRIIMQIIAQRRAALTDDATDLVSLLLRARDDDGNGLTDAQLRDEAITIFLAGHETTALALAYSVMLLAQHPEVQARAHAEIDAVLQDRPATAADFGRLPYIESIISESMRLYPPAWAVAREASESCALGGHRIRKGDQIWISQWVVHHDARWFPEPNEFKPERWTLEMREKLPRFAYFPFGGGPRICIGNHFALMEAVLALATTLQHRSFTMGPSHKLELECAVTMRPKRGVKVVPHAHHCAS